MGSHRELFGVLHVQFEHFLGGVGTVREVSEALNAPFDQSRKGVGNLGNPKLSLILLTDAF